MEKKNKSVLIALGIATALISVLLLEVWQVFRLTSNLTLRSGQYHLESISGELESTISDAKQRVMKLAIEAGELLDDWDELEALIYDRKAEALARNDSCFNLYIAGTGWSIIPDFDMPEDYIATERDWYKGAKQSQGNPYVTAPYVDAMTGNICYTVATLLGDKDTVLSLDYTMDSIQFHILQMYEGGSQYALIVTGDGIIAGCSDETLIGRSLSDALPEYSSVFSLVKSRQSFVTTRIKADILYDNLFATTSGAGWYLIVSESDWNLYRYSYLQLLGSAAFGLLSLIIIIPVYLLSDRRKRAALKLVRERDKLLSRISTQLEEPLRVLLEDSEASAEDFFKFRAAGRRILQTLRDVSVAAAESRESRKPQRTGNEQILRMNAQFRAKILLLMALVVAISFVSNFFQALRWGHEKLRSEVNSYDSVLSEWVGQQKSLLDMFCSVISTSPEMLDNYEETITYLNRITLQYPEISVSYMSNPNFEPNVYMNNGWKPPEGWRVEERQWYIDTLASESGWTISAPYFDDQTGLYCVTFAERVYDSETGRFLGNFGIDFFMDKLIDILGGSYSDTGYAFLSDTEGIIINHPYGGYQMTETNAANVSELQYGQVKPNGVSSITIRDYDGALRIVTAKRNADSRFTVYVAVSLASIYLPTILSEALILIALLICAIMVWRLLTALMLWQDEMNARMQEAADSAIAAGKAKSRFLAQMSHEIRTPINAVLGMNEMILRKTEDETILDYASNIQIAGRTLLSLINSILDFSKIEEGKMEIIPVEYDTMSVIHNLAASVSERASDKGLEFIVDADPNLPSRLYGDDVRLSQVIMNLLTNAVKYTEKGRVRLSVRGGTRKDGNLELKVAVEDTGIGIRQEDLSRLFESFERLDTVRNHSIEGTGLGMSIVTRLLEMMGSQLMVDSVYGKGSTFSFSVRQGIIDDAPVGDYSKRLTVSRAAPSGETLLLKGAKVLVVDDNEMNLKVAKNLMQLFGFTPELASSGMEAIERMRKTHYHIVFLDHMMPKMDGVQTLNALKEEKLLPDDTTVIVLTANAVNGAKEQYLALGFDDYLSKPIEVDKLEAELLRYLPKELRVTRAEGNQNALSGKASAPVGQTPPDGVASAPLSPLSAGETETAPQVALSRAQSALSYAQTALSEAQAALSNTQTALSDTQSKLSGTTAALSETQTALSDARSALSGATLSPLDAPSALSGATLSPLDAPSALSDTPSDSLSGERTRTDPISLLQAAGYDTQAALRYVAGDPDFYLELVKSFADSASRSAADIRRDWETRAFHNYQTRVHALKSGAKQIGANALSELALAQETAAKQGDHAAIDAGAENLLRRLDETARELRRALGLPEDATETASGGAAPDDALTPISPAELRDILTEAATRIDNFEAESATETLRPLASRSCGGLALGDAVREIAQALENFDTFAASERLNALLERIPEEQEETPHE